jgi:carbonic anhydrase
MKTNLWYLGLGLMLMMTFSACETDDDFSNTASEPSTISSKVFNGNSKVINGYPAWLVSTPLITSNLPQEVIESQTPIDITPGQTVKFISSTPILNYGTITLSNVLNNEGENLKINLSAADQLNNFVMIGGKKYTLTQFHFHYSSEHTINGQHKTMEIHFVNVASDNAHAVLGVLVDFGNYDENLQTLFNASPDVPGAVNSFSTQLNLLQLFPKITKLYYTYSGSLTTPNYGFNSSMPNNGPVTWIVYKHIKRLSRDQLNTYQAIYKEPNVRNTQPLNGRIVYEHLF